MVANQNNATTKTESWDSLLRPRSTARLACRSAFRFSSTSSSLHLLLRHDQQTLVRRLHSRRLPDAAGDVDVSGFVIYLHKKHNRHLR
jgi:hypothetical protein